LIEADAFVSPALTEACRGEAAWNLRNMATLGGTMVAATGRSPVAAALLALGAEVHGLPVDRWSTVEAFLSTRGTDSGFRLLTRFRWPTTTTLRFARVGRSPMDAPIVLVALGRAADSALRVVLGGWGPCPVRVPDAEQALASGDIPGAARAAAHAYATAGDAWASAEYRAEVAAVLVRRLAAEEKIPSASKDKSGGEAKGMVPKEPRGTA
jgi:carbon-monoxide dehydrogenase medium subunit